MVSQMNASKRKAFLFFGFCFITLFLQLKSQSIDQESYLSDTQQKISYFEKCCTTTKVSRGLFDIGADVVRLYRNLFDWDSFKVFTSFFPFYIAASMADDSLRDCFYNRTNHKNINQMHDHFHTFANNFSVGVVAAIAGTSYIFSHNDRLVQTSRAFLLGVPFVILTTDFIKIAIEKEISLRPWNQDFSCKKRSYGGFPSTHGAQLGYATVLFAKQMGWRFGVPFAALTAFVGGTFVNGNRHTLAQYIAGVGLGAMFAFAADKIVDERVAKHFDINLNIDAKIGPCIDLGFKF